MELVKIKAMIDELKDKKGKAFLTAVNTTVDQDELAEELLAIGECFGKAELLIQQAYVRAIRLSKKGVEFSELPTKPQSQSKLGEGEPIGHPPVSSLSDMLPIGSYSGTVEEQSVTDYVGEDGFREVFKCMLEKIGVGIENLSTLDEPGKTVCTTCGAEGTRRLEVDGEVPCICGGTVKHWLGVITEYA